jgi:hypothetical protein
MSASEPPEQIILDQSMVTRSGGSQSLHPGHPPKLDTAGMVTKQSPVLGIVGAQAWKEDDE